MHTNREQLNGFSRKLISKHFMKHCRLTSWRISKVKSGLCGRCTDKMSVLFPKMQRSALSTLLWSCLVITRNTSVRTSVLEHRSCIQASPYAHVTNGRRKHLLSKKWKYTFNTVAFTSVLRAILSFKVLLTRHRNSAFTNWKSRSNKTANTPGLLH